MSTIEIILVMTLLPVGITLWFLAVLVIVGIIVELTRNLRK